MARSFDANPNHTIPRMTFEFDPDEVGNLSEFSVSIPMSDCADAVRLPHKLGYMPRPTANDMMSVLDTLDVENEGGKLSVVHDDEAIDISFGFTPLPEKAVAPPSVHGIWDRMRQEQEPRMPHLYGREAVIAALMTATNLQYQFGAPVTNESDTIPTAPARLSFSDGTDAREPRVVVTKEFAGVLDSLAVDETSELTEQLYDYFVFLDPSRANTNPLMVTDGVQVGTYGRVFSNGNSSFGMRTPRFLSEKDLANPETDTDLRLQEGDAYICRGHNLDLVSNARMMALVSVGSIARLCRERRQS